MGFWKYAGKVALSTLDVVGESIIGATVEGGKAIIEEFQKDRSGEGKVSALINSTINVGYSSLKGGLKSAGNAIIEEADSFSKFYKEEMKNKKEQESLEKIARIQSQNQNRLEEILPCRNENLEMVSEERETIYSKIVGVTHGKRQEYIKELELYQYIEARREPDNIHDKNAIALYNGDNHLGYIKRGLAETLAPIIDEGNPINVQIISLTGYDCDTYNKGVNIAITFSKTNHTYNSDKTQMFNASNNAKEEQTSFYDAVQMKRSKKLILQDKNYIDEYIEWIKNQADSHNEKGNNLVMLSERENNLSMRAAHLCNAGAAFKRAGNLSEAIRAYMCCLEIEQLPIQLYSFAKTLYLAGMYEKALYLYLATGLMNEDFDHNTMTHAVHAYADYSNNKNSLHSQASQEYYLLLSGCDRIDIIDLDQWECDNVIPLFDEISMKYLDSREKQIDIFRKTKAILGDSSVLDDFVNPIDVLG